MKNVTMNTKFAISKYDKEDIVKFKNELFIYLLAKQKNLNYIPKLIHFDCNALTLKTENVGISLQEYCDNHACDLKSFIPKIRKIYNNLENIGYFHNDLRLKNIVINTKTKKLYLIDFEFTDRVYRDLDDEKLIEAIKSKKDKKDLKNYKLERLHMEDKEGSFKKKKRKSKNKYSKRRSKKKLSKRRSKKR